MQRSARRSPPFAANARRTPEQDPAALTATEATRGGKGLAPSLRTSRPPSEIRAEAIFLVGTCPRQRASGVIELVQLLTQRQPFGFGQLQLSARPFACGNQLFHRLATCCG